MASTLIVTADATTAQSLQTHLRTLGHEAEIAVTAGDAARRFHERAWDRALIDVMMPEHAAMRQQFAFSPVQEASLTLETMEKHHISRVLEHCTWNMSRAARILDIDRATLYNKVKRYDLRKP